MATGEKFCDQESQSCNRVWLLVNLFEENTLMLQRHAVRKQIRILKDDMKKLARRLSSNSKQTVDLQETEAEDWCVTLDRRFNFPFQLTSSRRLWLGEEFRPDMDDAVEYRHDAKNAVEVLQDFQVLYQRAVDH
eukprot:768056-Hanusia_phi.AAC.1